jgi:hypothetical protein
MHACFAALQLLHDVLLHAVQMGGGLRSLPARLSSTRNTDNFIVICIVCC